MRRFGIWTVVIVTALISSALTSAFWLIAFNRGPVTTAAAPVPRQAEAQPAPAKAAIEIGPSGLAIPVAGIKAEALANTYKQARSGGRVHNAIDIMAPHGTPVVAAAPGVVEKLFFSQGGGITVYVRSPDKQWMFYYAHLDAYAPGLEEGQPVKQGDVLGTVGSTGNASPSGPHLHFAVNRMAAGEDWHEGSPVNPYPLLAGDKGR